MYGYKIASATEGTADCTISADGERARRLRITALFQQADADCVLYLMVTFYCVKRPIDDHHHRLPIRGVPPILNVTTVGIYLPSPVTTLASKRFRRGKCMEQMSVGLRSCD